MPTSGMANLAFSVSTRCEPWKEINFEIVDIGDQRVARTRVWGDWDLEVFGCLEANAGGGKRASAKLFTKSVQLVPFASFAFVAVLFALIVLVVPYTLWPKTVGNDHHGAWYQLLSEPNGGYSLSRCQLLLWFVPVIVLYAAQSFVARTFLPLDAQLQILLGLSGATTLLGTAASPSDGTDMVRRAPSLSDLVKDWDDHGDVSRYQYLLLSAFGAVVLVVGFFANMEFPVLPDQFLYLIAASQGTYVATKAVKQAKSGDSEQSTVTHAPASVTPAPAPGTPAPASGSNVLIDPPPGAQPLDPRASANASSPLPSGAPASPPASPTPDAAAAAVTSHEPSDERD